MKYLAALGLVMLVVAPVAGQVLTESNLPIIIIDTHGLTIYDDPKVKADMGIIDNGPGAMNHVTDPFNNYNGKIGIEYRGSSSQMFPKKPYGIELRDANDQDISASILGMPEEEDWVLIATYNDKSLMRDALAYKLGRDQNRYAPRTRFCELIIKNYESNPQGENEYLGVYMVAEKIKKDKNRVDISTLNSDEVTGDDLTGGYILKIDKGTGSGGSGFYAHYNPPNRSGNQEIYLMYEYPAEGEIVSAQQQYIQQFMKNFELTLNSVAFQDPVNGYRKYIDVQSFVDYLIMNELSKNVDGYRLSTYMYKDKDSKGGKLSMGPIWDYNLAFGNADYCEGWSKSGWMYYFNSVCPTDYWLIPFWWSSLMRDSWFRQQVAARWVELRAGKFSTPAIHAYIDSVATVMNAGPQQRNFQKWPVMGQYVWPNYFVGSFYQQEVDWLKDWVEDRAHFLDVNFPQVVTGTEQPEINPNFRLIEFPNPFDETLRLDYELTVPGSVDVELLDIMGRKMRVLQMDHTAPGKFTEIIDPQNLPRGGYVLRAKFNGQPAITKKLIRK